MGMAFGAWGRGKGFFLLLPLQSYCLLLPACQGGEGRGWGGVLLYALGRGSGVYREGGGREVVPLLLLTNPTTMPVYELLPTYYSLPHICTLQWTGIFGLLCLHSFIHSGIHFSMDWHGDRKEGRKEEDETVGIAPASLSGEGSSPPHCFLSPVCSCNLCPVSVSLSLSMGGEALYSHLSSFSPNFLLSLEGLRVYGRWENTLSLSFLYACSLYATLSSFLTHIFTCLSLFIHIFLCLYVPFSPHLHLYQEEGGWGTPCPWACTCCPAAFPSPLPPFIFHACPPTTLYIYALVTLYLG